MKSTVIAATSTLDTANDRLTDAALSRMAEMAGGMEIKAGFKEDSPVVGKVIKSVSVDGKLSLDCEFNNDVERLYVVPGFKAIDYEIVGKDRILKNVDLMALSITATPQDFHLTKISDDEGVVMKEYWIVGEWIECENCNKAWEFMGVFETEKLAIEACTKDNYFVGPARINEKLPKQSIPWIGAYYPLLEKTSRFLASE